MNKPIAGTGARLLLGLGLAVLVLIWCPALVRTQEPVNITLNGVDSSEFPRVVAYVTVSDHTGHAIPNLLPDAFTLSEDRNPVDDVAAEFLENVGEPILLALALDTSGSMAGTALSNAQAAAVQLINDLGPADKVSVLSFNDTVETQVELTADKAAAIAAVQALSAGGDTAFNDAVYEGARLLASRPRGRKALVVLTDGEDTSSVLTIDDAISAAQEASVPVYAVGFGPDIRPRILERLALLTGGHLYRTPSSEQIGESFQAVARLLRYQYVLRFDSSLPADDRPHTLRVDVNVEGIRAHAEIPFTAVGREIALAMVAPAEGSTVGGMVTLTPRIEAPGDVLQVDYLLDGDPLATVTTGDFSYAWDATTVPIGRHTLTVRVTDSATNEGEADLNLTVAEPVEIAFVAPADNLTDLSGEVEVAVEVVSLAGVSHVDFAVDDQVVETLESPPYRFDWDTGSVATGDHQLAATAYDVNGLSDRATLDVWVAFRGTSWGLWAVLGLVLVVGGLMVPLALRRRRRVVRQPTAAGMPSTAVAPPVPRPGDATTERSDQPEGEPVAWLVVEAGPDAGSRWPVVMGETRLGRTRSANDVVIPSSTASRRHASILADVDGFVYYDIEPTNPTLTNDVPIVGSHELLDGDRIQIGDIILRFEKEG